MTSSRPLYMGNIVNGGALRSSLIPSLALRYDLHRIIPQSSRLILDKILSAVKATATKKLISETISNDVTFGIAS